MRLQGVANRDIKLENILLDESQPRPLIKISDFGFSKVRRMRSHRRRLRKGLGSRN